MLVLLAELLSAGGAWARTWAEWAPEPLPSERPYAEMAARPVGELSPRERQWLAVQRDWRDQRELESHTWNRGIAEDVTRRERPGDERFARLASRPYAELGDADLAWLVGENLAQRKAGGRLREVDRRALATIATTALIGVAGLILFLVESSGSH